MRPRVHISAEKTAAIRGRLSELPNLTAVSKEFEVSVSTVRHVSTPQAGYVHRQTVMTSPIRVIVFHISGGMTVANLNQAFDFNAGTFENFFALPETYSAKWIRAQMVPKMLKLFPEKRTQVRIFEVLSCDLRPMSAAQIKISKATVEFRQTTGILLRELRHECGYSLENIQNQIPNQSVRNNLARIEAEDLTIAASLYRAAIAVLAPMYHAAHPQSAAPYMPLFEQLQRRLKR